MAKRDYGDLEVERARILVSLEEARGLVTQWMGPNFKEDDDQIEVKVSDGLSTTVGLGFKVKETPEMKQLALTKLKKKYQAEQERQKQALNNAGPETEETQDQEESRSTIKLANKQLKQGRISKNKKKKKSVRKFKKV